MQNCISVDWLQLHVKVPSKRFEAIHAQPEAPKQTTFDSITGRLVVRQLDESEAAALDEIMGNAEAGKKQMERKKELASLEKKYLIKRDNIQTRNFKTIYVIQDRKSGEDIAVLAADPRNEMCMQSDSGLLKIVNKRLYQKDLGKWVRLLLKELSLTFINITRLDIAYDFLEFDTMSCDEFINRFAAMEYLKSIKSNFKMMGETWSVDKGNITGGITSLKFGKETSDVSYYLYNKTLELQQVKHKPWIHEHWKSNGWKGDKSVYRLEFSLRPDTRGIVTEDGEVFHFKDLSMIDRIADVYKHMFNKHFNFVKLEHTKKGNVRKQSRSEKIVLFNELKFSSVTIELSDKKDSGRADKIFAKRLMLLNQELRGTHFDLGIMGNELMTWVIATRDLKTWAKKKLPDIHLSDNILQMIEGGKNSKLMSEV